MKILRHNEYKIINLWYPTYVYYFLIFLIITKIECWPVFKQDPNSIIATVHRQIHSPQRYLLVKLAHRTVSLVSSLRPQQKQAS